MLILPTLDGGTIGEEMMIEVLLSLPIDTLRRACLVSRNWEDFIGSPQFNRMYYKRNPPTKEVLAFPVTENSLGLLSDTNPPDYYGIRLPIECKEMEMKMIGSCDGLLGFVQSRRRGFLWNPANQRGKFFDLPPVPPQNRISTGIGYDSSRYDYKFVILTSSDETEVKIYSSLNDSWHDLFTVPFTPETDSNSSFILNGVPYWVGKGKGEDAKRSVVFSFDPALETYQLIPYPAVEPKQFYVVRLRDSLGGLAYSTLDHKVDVFLHQDDEWVKLATTGPINSIDVRLMRYFKQTIISCSPLAISYYSTQPLLRIANLLNPIRPRFSESYYHLDSMVCLSGAGFYCPRSVGEVFRDYTRRRSTLIRALTTESEEFCQFYEFEEDLSPHSGRLLYGNYDHWWIGDSNKLRTRQEPGEFPEPIPCPKFPKQSSSVEMSEWLCTIALNCDKWLLSVALHSARSFGFNRANRVSLISLITDLPAMSDVVSDHWKQLKEGTLILDK